MSNGVIIYLTSIREAEIIIIIIIIIIVVVVVAKMTIP
jgi:hypothetical protein